MTVARRVLVVGYLSMDTVQLPGAQPVQVPGGAALYAALGARHAGAQAVISAAVGEDFPRQWLESLARLGIDVSGVQQRPGATRTSRLNYDAAGGRESPHHHEAGWWERTIAMAPAPSGAAAAACDGVVACPMAASALAALLRWSRQHALPVVADTSDAFVERDRDGLLRLVNQLQVFAPSREETRSLWPELGDDAAAQALAALGVNVVQKRGSQGAVAVSAHDVALVRLAAPQTRVVDTTGAGDATVGALAAMLAQGVSFLDAARAALHTGALATTGMGPAALGLGATV